MNGKIRLIALCLSCLLAFMPLSALAENTEETVIPEGIEVEGMASAGPVHAAGLLAEELDRLVERILVSAEDGRQEVRLTLSDRILPGTEIILSRTPEGMLSVALHCTDASSFQTLVASQFDLKKRLEEHEMASVEVSVDIQQEGGDADRRSRGYFALDPDEARKTDDA